MGRVGNNSGINPIFFATSGPTKPRKHSFSFYFLNIGRGLRKVNDLLISTNNQLRDYHTWNRIEKLMPQHWNFAPQTLKTWQTTTNLFSNLDFLQKSGFPKTLDLSMGFPRIFHGSPWGPMGTPWPDSLGFWRRIPSHPPMGLRTPFYEQSKHPQCNQSTRRLRW